MIGLPGTVTASHNCPLLTTSPGQKQHRKAKMKDEQSWLAGHAQ